MGSARLRFLRMRLRLIMRFDDEVVAEVGYEFVEDEVGEDEIVEDEAADDEAFVDEVCG